MFWTVVLALVALFSFVLLFGAPYLPTRRAQGQAALDLLKLPKGAHLIELGCGDGRMLRLAASQGLRVTGYEINPLLAVVSWLMTYRYRSQVKVKLASLWKADLSTADGIYVFLLDRFMPRLDTKISRECRRPVALASYAFKIPSKKASAHKQGVFLYRYRPSKGLRLRG